MMLVVFLYLLSIMISIHLLFAVDDSALGRFQKESLPSQDLLEMLVCGLDGVDRLKDRRGDFLDIHKWKAIAFDQKDNVISVHFNTPVSRDLAYDRPPLKRSVGSGGTIDLQWLPHTVVSFESPSMQFQGTIETALLPSGLFSFNAKSNQFRGTFDIAHLPSNIEYVIIDRNALEGSLDLPALPRRVKEFLANENQFSGSIDLDNLPQTLKRLSIAHNALTGRLSLLCPSESLRYLYFEGNQFDTSVFQISVPKTLAEIVVDVVMCSNVVDATGSNVFDRRILGFTIDKSKPFPVPQWITMDMLTKDGSSWNK